MLEKVLHYVTNYHLLSKLLRLHTDYVKKTVSKYTDMNFLLNLATRQTQLYKSIPIRLKSIDSSNALMFVPETAKHIRVLKYKSILHTSLVGLQLFQCLLSSTTLVHQKQSAFDKIFGWLSFLMLLTTSIFLHVTRIHGPILGSYFNNIFDISKRIIYVPKLSDFATNKARLILLAAPILLFSGNVFGPILVFGFHWKNPCKSSLVGYFILEECYVANIETLGIITVIRRGLAKTAAFIVNSCIWNLGGSSGGFLVTVCYIISPIVQQEIIQLMRKALNDDQNMHNDLCMYRQLQILNTLCNNTQKVALGAMIVCGTLWTSISLAFLVSSLKGGQQKTNGFVYATFGLSISNCTIALVVVLGGLLSVSLKSEKYLKDISKLELTQKSREKRLWIRLYSRSCSKVKIQFGDNNFLESLTPLRCLDWAANIAVQILLVSGV